MFYANLFFMVFIIIAAGCTDKSTPLPPEKAPPKEQTQPMAESDVPTAQNDATARVIDAAPVAPITPDAAIALDAASKPAKKTKRIKTKTTKAKPAPKGSCSKDKQRIDSKYQAGLRKKKHLTCKRDADCILLPEATRCSNRTCPQIRKASTNRKYAKAVYALTYNSDQQCDSLNRQCGHSILKKRSRAKCSEGGYEAVCVNQRCKAQKKKRKTIVIPKSSSLLLGQTRASDRRFQMKVASTLIMERTQGFEQCRKHGKNKSGDATFVFEVSSKGAAQKIRTTKNTLNPKLANCIQQWFRGVRYPKPKGKRVKITQSVTYIAP